ncbi:MAG: type II toxin-antitoxin system PemK/MazF family toxin [Tatlockia sp.]|nr:type II toxin-antitoxin system PemK/MazF family toxin [Tatlockia sp.]
MIPVSKTQRRNPFYVQIPEGEPVTGVIIADQLRSLDYRARGEAFINECPQELFAEVLRRISPILF